MRVLVTFPGRYGDILWALPAVRALSRRLGQPLDLAVAENYRSITALLDTQPYIRRAFYIPEWTGQETAPMTPRIPPPTRITGAPNPESYDVALHLGYRGWPARPLPFETLDCLNAELGYHRDYFERRITPGFRWPLEDAELALDEPWITVAPWTQVPHPLVVGWSAEHFELKYGLTYLLAEALALPGPGSAFVLCGPNSRWQTEGGFTPTDWIENARRLAAAQVFLGCCSALHVLAVALGKPCVIMEPAEARWNDSFYPLGKTGRVRLVTGGDGLPTFDSRHVRDVVEEALHAPLR